MSKIKLIIEIEKRTYELLILPELRGRYAERR